MQTQRVVVESEGASFEFVRAAPPRHQQQYINEYVWYAEHGRPAIQRQFPGGRLPLIISLGDGMGVAPAGETPQELSRPPAFHSFMAGLHDTFTDTAMSGHWRGLQLDFTPAGARHFLGRPLGELTNQVAALPDLLGPAGTILVEQLQEAATPEACFALVEQVIDHNLARQVPASEALAWAWSRLSRSPHCDIQSLADQLGWSRKHLAVKFRHELGMTPKLAARVLRFERANRMATASESPCWADIAAACGYYDQSHLVRDFQQFTGSTPTASLDRMLLRRPAFEDDDDTGSF